MGVEKVDEMPVFDEKVRLIYRELVDTVNNAEQGDVIKFTREDDKKVTIATIRTILEKRTKKPFIVKKYDGSTAFIKMLSSSEAQKEAAAREIRSKEMKKKLAGKGK